MQKFALIGNGPLLNRGCEAIVYGTVGILNNMFGDCSYLLASFSKDSPELLPQAIQPLSLPFRLERWSKLWWQYRLDRLMGRPENITSFLTELKENLDDVKAAFSIGGDGYAIEYGHQIVDRLIVMDDFIKSKGIPIIIWGASIGPFTSEPEFEKKIAKHFSNIDLIVVREPVSLEYLSSLGIIDNVRLAPDPAFVLEPSVCELPEDVQKILSQGCIGINLSPLLARFATSGNLTAWISLAAQLVENIQDSFGLPVLLIPHVIISNIPGSDDASFLSSVYSFLHKPYREKAALVPTWLNSKNLKWVISQTSLFIGARTHSTIAALSSGVPCLSIAYSVKARGINEFLFGNNDWVFSSSELPDIVKFMERVTLLMEKREQVKSHLNTIHPNIVEQAYSLGPLIDHLLR